MWVLPIAALLYLRCIGAFAEDIDLTHLIAEGKDEGWPVLSRHKYKHTIIHNGSWNGVHLYNAEFFAPEHSGTHVDSPSHFGLGKWTIDQIPLDRLSGPGVVIDISKKAEKDPDSLLNIKDIKAWERLHGKVPKGAIVIMNSGWYKYYGDKKYYNWEEGYPETDTKHMHFPGFSAEAVDYLIRNSQIVGIAVDTVSIDRGQDNNLFEAHRRMSESNVWGIENIGNLDKLPAKGFLVYNLPLKFKDGSGSPVRVFAVMGGDKSTIMAQQQVQQTSSGHNKISNTLVLATAFAILRFL